ncbi:hypothetical protein [Endozoicomonas lisbonensis]|uniref:hypothetical protein n=1 Tax=Endozoicomonas lisbonensis TaxID=3120522 RepID=UPI0033971EEE
MPVKKNLKKFGLISGFAIRRFGATRLLLLLAFCLHLVFCLNNAFADTADNGLHDQEPFVTCQEQPPASFSIGSLTFVLDVDFRSLKTTVDDILQTMLMLKLAHAGYHSYRRMRWPGLADTLIQAFYTGWQSYLILSSRLLFAGRCIDKGVTYLRRMRGNCTLWQEMPVYIEDPELARRVYLKVVNRGGASALVIRVLPSQPETVAPRPVNYRAMHNLADWMEAHFIQTVEVAVTSDPETMVNGSKQLELILNGREGWKLPLPVSDVSWLQEPCQFGQEAYSSMHTLLSPQWLDWITESLRNLEQQSKPGEKENPVKPPDPTPVTRHGSSTTAINGDADEGAPYWILFANADTPYIQISRPSSSLPDYDPGATSVLAAGHSSQIVWRDQDVYDTFWSVQLMQAIASIRIQDTAQTIQSPAIEAEGMVASETTGLREQTDLREEKLVLSERPLVKTPELPPAKKAPVAQSEPAAGSPEQTPPAKKAPVAQSEPAAGSPEQPPPAKKAPVAQSEPAAGSPEQPPPANKAPVAQSEPAAGSPEQLPPAKKAPVAQSEPAAGSPEQPPPSQQKPEKKSECSGPCKGIYPASQLVPAGDRSQEKLCKGCERKQNGSVKQSIQTASKAIEQVKKEIRKTQYDVRSAKVDEAINLIYGFTKDPDEEKIRTLISTFVDVFLSASMEVLNLFSPSVLDELKYHKKNKYRKDVENIVIEQTKNNIAIYLRGLNRLAKFYKTITLESLDRLRKKESETEPLKTPFTMGLILFYLEKHHDYISRALAAFSDREEEKLLKELFNTATVVPLLLDTLNFLDAGRMQWTLHYDEEVSQMAGLSEQSKWEELLPTMSRYYRSNDQKYLLRIFVTWLGQSYYSRSLYLFLSSKPSLKIPEETMAEILSGLPAMLRSSIKIKNDDYSHKAFSLFTQMPGKAKSFLKAYLLKNTAFREDFYSSLYLYLYYIHYRYHQRVPGYTEHFIEQGYPAYFDEDIRRLDRLFADEFPALEKQQPRRSPDSVLEEHRRRLNIREAEDRRTVERAEQAQKRRFERYLKDVSKEKEIKDARDRKKLEKARNRFFIPDNEAKPEPDDKPQTTDQTIELAAMESPWEIGMNEVAESYAQKDFAYSIQCINKAIDLSSDDEQLVLASYEKASLYANELFRKTREAMNWLNNMGRYERIAAQLDIHFITDLINRPELPLKERFAMLELHNIQFASREDRENYITNAVRLHREVSKEIESWRDLVADMLKTVELLNERLELLDTVDQLRVEGAFVSEAMIRATAALNRLKQAPAEIMATEQKTKDFVTALGVYGANNVTKKSKSKAKAKAKAKKKPPSLGRTYKKIEWVIPDLSPVDTLIGHLASPSETAESEPVPESRATAFPTDLMFQMQDSDTATNEPDTAKPKRKTKQPKPPTLSDFGDKEFYLPEEMWWMLEEKSPGLTE